MSHEPLCLESVTFIENGLKDILLSLCTQHTLNTDALQSKVLYCNYEIEQFNYSSMRPSESKQLMKLRSLAQLILVLGIERQNMDIISKKKQEEGADQEPKFKYVHNDKLLKRRVQRLQANQKEELEDWYLVHKDLSRISKKSFQDIAERASLTDVQVRNWVHNKSRCLKGVSKRVVDILKVDQSSFTE
ncbi:hypothetical protein PSN45_004423 [Yamadazyma tenuis]|uniref:uncharacterized protein n=1 Tax=Candida tenuis TaxID=2315449 RepID=UPI00279DB6BA|nr:hypothetical protein PSN45_004423 [Yamadazyma tenuis]